MLYPPFWWIFLATLLQIVCVPIEATNHNLPAMIKVLVNVETTQKICTTVCKAPGGPMVKDSVANQQLNMDPIEIGKFGTQLSNFKSITKYISSSLQNLNQRGMNNKDYKYDIDPFIKNVSSILNERNKSDDDKYQSILKIINALTRESYYNNDTGCDLNTISSNVLLTLQRLNKILLGLTALERLERRGSTRTSDVGDIGSMVDFAFPNLKPDNDRCATASVRVGDIGSMVDNLFVNLKRDIGKKTKTSHDKNDMDYMIDQLFPEIKPKKETTTHTSKTNMDFMIEELFPEIKPEKETNEENNIQLMIDILFPDLKTGNETNSEKPPLLDPGMDQSIQEIIAASNGSYASKEEEATDLAIKNITDLLAEVKKTGFNASLDKEKFDSAMKILLDLLEAASNAGSDIPHSEKITTIIKLTNSLAELGTTVLANVPPQNTNAFLPENLYNLVVEIIKAILGKLGESTDNLSKSILTNQTDGEASQLSETNPEINKTQLALEQLSQKMGIFVFIYNQLPNTTGPSQPANDDLLQSINNNLELLKKFLNQTQLNETSIIPNNDLEPIVEKVEEAFENLNKMVTTFSALNILNNTDENNAEVKNIVDVFSKNFSPAINQTGFFESEKIDELKQNIQGALELLPLILEKLQLVNIDKGKGNNSLTIVDELKYLINQLVSGTPVISVQFDNNVTDLIPTLNKTGSDNINLINSFTHLKEKFIKIKEELSLNKDYLEHLQKYDNKTKTTTK